MAQPDSTDLYHHSGEIRQRMITDIRQHNNEGNVPRQLPSVSAIHGANSVVFNGGSPNGEVFNGEAPDDETPNGVQESDDDDERYLSNEDAVACERLARLQRRVSVLKERIADLQSLNNIEKAQQEDDEQQVAEHNNSEVDDEVETGIKSFNHQIR